MSKKAQMKKEIIDVLEATDRLLGVNEIKDLVLRGRVLRALNDLANAGKIEQTVLGKWQIKNG